MPSDDRQSIQCGISNGQNGSNSSLGSLVSSLRSLLSSTSSTGWLATAGLLSDTSLPMPDTEQPPIAAPHTAVQTLQGWPSGLQIPGDGDFQEAPEEPQEMPNEPLAVESRRSPSRRGVKRPLPEDGGRPTVAGTIMSTNRGARIVRHPTISSKTLNVALYGPCLAHTRGVLAHFNGYLEATSFPENLSEMHEAPLFSELSDPHRHDFKWTASQVSHLFLFCGLSQDAEHQLKAHWIQDDILHQGVINSGLRIHTECRQGTTAVQHALTSSLGSRRPSYAGGSSA